MRTRIQGLVLASALALAMLLAGCTTPTDDETEINEATFTARDYAFEGPASLPAGLNRITVTNEGPDLHHIQFVRLPQGKTMGDLIDALNENMGHPPEWADLAGGPNAAIPSGTSTALVELEAGNYAIVCVIPDSEGVPHFAHGMQKEITVTATSGPDAEPPEPTHEVSLVDFAFAQDEPIAAGDHVIEVTNDGGQPHELVLVKLEEGRTGQDVLDSFSPNATGPPPGTIMGGITGIDAGESQSFEVTLEPGPYSYICFFADPESGAPHFALGMMQDFEVA